MPSAIKRALRTMTVKIEGLDAIVKKIDSLGKSGVMKRPMTKSISHIHDLIAKAPRKKPGAFSALAKPAQKRAFWARVGSGEINFREGIGYVRSNVLVNKWTSKVSGDGRRGEVGTNVPYAPLVQSDARQQLFHKASGWPTVEQVVKKATPYVLARFKAAYDKAVK